jgi:two-component system, cell cycle sensor histidine kinase and response regulator CckA
MPKPDGRSFNSTHEDRKAGDSRHEDSKTSRHEDSKAGKPSLNPCCVTSLTRDANFELLFTKHPDAMYIFDDATLRFLEVNDAALRAYGYDRAELLRMKVTDIRPPEDVPRLKASIEAVRGSVASRGYWRHRRKNGEIFDVEITAQKIPFDNRGAVLVVARDVSERRATEKKIAQRTAFLNALMENNPLAIIAIDNERRAQTCNAAFTQLFGYSVDEIAGKKLEDLIALPGLESESVRLHSESQEHGELLRTTTKRRRKDGSVVDVKLLGVPLIVNGERQGSFGIYEDMTEQIRAEERHQRIFENAIEGFFESTPTGHFLTVNPAMARIAGYASPAEMIEQVTDIGKQLYVDPEFRKTVKRELEDKGYLEGFECHMLRKDGSKIWISMNVRALRDANGNVITHDGTAEDITERKRSELERQVTTDIIHAVSVTDNLDALLRAIHASLNTVLDAKNCFVALNDPATGEFHFPFFADEQNTVPPPQKMERTCTAYVYRTGKAMLVSPATYKRLIEEGEIVSLGRVTPAAAWLGVPLHTPTERIGVLAVRNYQKEGAYTERDLEFLSSVGRQIAFAIERKRAEDRLRESEARLRVLIEQLPAVLWTVDKNLRFTSALGAGLTRLGLKPNEIVGMTLPEYFETSDASFLPVSAHKRAIAGEAVTFHVDWKDGSYACHVEPLRNAEGELQGAICMALDVTDRKQLEEQFRQAQKMEAIGRLAGGIAHDFNNLLMVIQGYADLMTDRFAPDDPLRKNAVQIQTAAQRAAALTQQLLAFSRKQMLAPKVLNIQTVVADLEKMLRRLIGEDVELQTSSAPDLWLVKADRSQIEQVIMNLAVNARDAMPQGGRVTIETANVELDGALSHPPAMLAPGKYVMLAVTDNGCGMDEKTQAHIFEPFFTTKEKGKGTGLGLATVYGIVKQSGGYIWVYSEPGHGTTFKVYLPRIEEEVRKGARDLVIAPRALPRGSEVVLLVEDEKGVRELAREYLEMSGYTVIEAEDGHTALELAAMHAGPIHLLMTDVVMPGISGRELADRVLHIRPGIKVLYMSGYTDQAVVRHGILDSDAVLLQKPFSLATLAAKLRDVLTAETVH